MGLAPGPRPPRSHVRKSWFRGFAVEDCETQAPAHLEQFGGAGTRSRCSRFAWPCRCLFFPLCSLCGLHQICVPSALSSNVSTWNPATKPWVNQVLPVGSPSYRINGCAVGGGRLGVVWSRPALAAFAKANRPMKTRREEDAITAAGHRERSGRMGRWEDVAYRWESDSGLMKEHR
jgi:hypothetical protein